MESSTGNNTPLNKAQFFHQRTDVYQSRSAPPALSKVVMTSCRRVGLKRKSNPGTIFQSPLKENLTNCKENSTSSSVNNNLFCEESVIANREEIDSGAPAVKIPKESDTPDLPLSNESILKIKQDQSPKRHFSVRSVTPILSRRTNLPQYSLSKKLNLSSGNSDVHLSMGECSRTTKEPVENIESLKRVRSKDVDETEQNNGTVKIQETMQNLMDIMEDVEVAAKKNLCIERQQNKCKNSQFLVKSSDITKHSRQYPHCLSINDAMNLSKLQAVINKNHSLPFSVLSEVFSSDPEGGTESDLEKKDVILRVKKLHNEIATLKQLLSNAKQHDISKLQLLTEKWRDGCQQALLCLLEKIQEQGHDCNMSQLLTNSGIPSKLVKYDEDVQDFVT